MWGNSNDDTEAVSKLDRYNPGDILERSKGEAGRIEVVV
jgi:hypothetical protein